MDFELLIIGTDEKAYSLARSCFDRYRKKAYLIGNKKYKITHNSNILNVDYYDNLDNTSIFINTLKDFALDHSGKYLILISADVKYIELIIDNAKILKNYYLFNYCTREIYQQFINPTTYFKLLEKYNISFPQFYVQNLNNKINTKNIIKIGFPLVIKDKNQNYVKNINNASEFKTIVKSKKNTLHKLFIVEKIDDSVENNYFSTLIYCDDKKNMEFSTVSNLELYHESNYQVLINGYNIDDKLKNEVKKVQTMLSDIGYRGFLELIWQYNKKLDKYLLINFSMNIPSSSYILVNCGYNLIERLVDNLMYHKYYQFEYIEYEICLSIIPKIKLLRQIENIEYKKEVNKLIRMNKYINLYVKKEINRRQK